MRIDWFKSAVPFSDRACLPQAALSCQRVPPQGCSNAQVAVTLVSGALAEATYGRIGSWVQPLGAPLASAVAEPERSDP